MALPAIPVPPAPAVKRFNADGTPTPAQVEYETRLMVWQRAVAAQVGN